MIVSILTGILCVLLLGCSTTITPPNTSNNITHPEQWTVSKELQLQAKEVEEQIEQKIKQLELTIVDQKQDEDSTNE